MLLLVSIVALSHWEDVPYCVKMERPAVTNYTESTDNNRITYTSISGFLNWEARHVISCYFVDDQTMISSCTAVVPIHDLT